MPAEEGYVSFADRLNARVVEVGERVKETREGLPETDGPTKSLLQGGPPPNLGEMAAFGTEIAGGVIGGAAGARVGQPAAGVAAGRLGGAAAARAVGGIIRTITAASGGGAGGLAGSELGQVVTEARGGAPESADEANARRREAFLLNAAGEGAVPVVGAALGGVKKLAFRSKFFQSLRPRKADKSVPGGLEAQRVVIEALDEAGVNLGESLTPGVIREGWVRGLEGIAEAGVGGRGLIRRRRLGAARAVELEFDKIIREFGESLPPKDLGKVWDDAITGANKTARALTRGAYKALDTKVAEAAHTFRATPGKVVTSEGTSVVPASSVPARAGDKGTGTVIDTIVSKGGGIVDIQPAFSAMKRELATAAAAGDRKALGILTLLEKFSDTTVGLGQADKIRSALLSMSRQSSNDLMGDVGLKAGQAAGLVDDAMKVAELKLGTLGEEIRELTQVARKLSRTSHETFDDDVIAMLAGKSSPEEIAEALMRHNRPTAIEKTRNIIFDPQYAESLGRPPAEVWGEIQSSYLDTLTVGAKGKRAGDVGFNTLRGNRLVSALEDAEGGGALRELFPEVLTRKRLMATAKAIELGQLEQASKGGFSVAVRLFQAGAGLRTAQWALSMGPAQPGTQQQTGNFVILLAPALLASVLSRRGFTNWVTAVNRTSASARSNPRVLSQLGVRLVNELLEMGIPFTFQDEKGEKIPVPAGGGGPVKVGNKPRSNQ